MVGYLNVLARELDRTPDAVPGRRSAAIALWHAAKAAQVRDFAERVLRGDVPPNEPTREPLGYWLAERLLTTEELAAFERQSNETKGPGPSLE